MRDPDSSARAARRFEATHFFIVRLAKRFVAECGAHASPRNPAYHHTDPLSWETSDLKIFNHWIGPKGITVQGIAPRCWDFNGCHGEKARDKKFDDPISAMTIDQLIVIEEEDGIDLGSVRHHLLSRNWRHTHRNNSSRKGSRLNRRRH
jgi:hypothetical protein